MKNMMTLVWMLMACIFIAAGVSIMTSSTVTMRINGEPINFLFSSLCIAIAIWFASISYNLYRSNIKYTLISSAAIALLMLSLSTSQISLLMSDELITYKYLTMYGVIFLISVLSMVSMVMKNMGNKSA